MGKIIFRISLIAGFLICSNRQSFSQTVLQGLNYTYDWQSAMNNLYTEEMLDLEAKKKMEASQKAAYEEKKKKAEACSKNLKETYKGFTSYPKNISDGWHNVSITNNYDFCDDRKVLISNNKITKYFIDDWLERTIGLSGAIKEGKTIVKIKQKDGTLTELYDVYFIENIVDSTTMATAPNPGDFSFYTSYSKGGKIDIYVEGMFAGTLDSYFDEEAGCGEEGTVTIKYKPGTYNYVAKSQNGKYKWSGQITIVGNKCKKLALTK